VAKFYSARSKTILPFPWQTFALPFSACAQTWVTSFAGWYNGDRLHSAIRFVTPNMRHAGQDGDALANRAQLYANARAQKPER